jgi:hypothetical protein
LAFWAVFSMGLLGHFLVFIDFGSKQNLLSNLFENVGFFPLAIVLCY